MSLKSIILSSLPHQCFNTTFFFLLIFLADQALTQKMNEKISSQEMKLTFLQKKVDSIAAAMNDVSKVLSSLEGKINEDKGKDFQSFLKGKKNKLMQSLTQLKVPEKNKC